MQKTQRRRLYRAAEIKRTLLERGWQIRRHHFANFAAGIAIEHQAESPFWVVLANENHGPLEEGAAQLTAVQQQLPFQEFPRLDHAHGYPKSASHFAICKSKRRGKVFPRLQ